MEQIVIASSSVMPLLVAFGLGIFLGWLLSYQSALRKGYERAIQERNREQSAQAFAQYIQSIAQGVRNEPADSHE